MRKVAAPTPSPSSPAACRASSQCSADVLAKAYSGTLPSLLLTAMVGVTVVRWRTCCNG